MLEYTLPSESFLLHVLRLNSARMFLSLSMCHHNCFMLRCCEYECVYILLGVKALVFVL